MRRIAISIVIVVILCMATLKAYVSKPRALEIRELTQEKASPGEAMVLTQTIFVREKKGEQ
jgi:hypothetical protein